MPTNNIIYGPPGTGKTHALLTLAEEEMARGVHPDRIAFVTFTKKAANEARDRAMEKFNLEEQHLPYFRTLHSLAFHELGLSKSQVMSKKHYKEFASKFGMNLGYISEGPVGSGILTVDNELLTAVNQARMRCLSLQEYYNKKNMAHHWPQLKWTHEAFEKYKKERHLIDFTDMIENYNEGGMVPPLDVIFVDEAQDLCRLQLNMIDKLKENVQKIYYGGDDDQAIYGFAGADANHFINLKGNKKVLKQSYRCPISVQNLSQEIIDRVEYRHPKEWKGTNKKGLVQYHNVPGSVDLSAEGTWLIEARTQYLLSRMETDLRSEGIVYMRNEKLPVSKKLLNAVDCWGKLTEGDEIDLEDVKSIYSYMSTQIGIEHGYKHLKTATEERYGMEELVMRQGLMGEVAAQPWDIAFDKVGNDDKDFIRAMQARNYSLTDEPRIQLSTIHASKGGEADNVMLLTDLSRKARLAMHRDPDNECRVFYVGVTRAKEALHVVQPQDYGGFHI